MSLRRPCLQAGCRRFTEGPGSMCPEHAAALRRQRNADRALFAAMCEAATACAICGGPRSADDPFAVDHVLALSAGGTSESSNLRVVHRSCNNRVRYQ